MRESWKVIEDHPRYEVSNMGNVRNKQTQKLLHPYDDGNGYLRVKLDRVNCRLHILVAVAFVPNPDNKPVVNHKKGKKHDCRASQLEWAYYFRKHTTRMGSWTLQAEKNGQKKGGDAS